MFGEHRPDAVLAFVLDTLDAVAMSSRLAALVVTSDAAVQAAVSARAPGVGVLDDDASRDLNAALTAAAAQLPAGVPVAVVPGDLPALRAGQLAIALDRAGYYPGSYLPDAAGTGTTLLTALHRELLRPAFGRDSAGAHARAGMHQLETDELDSLRCDVDTAADLRVAVKLGVGKHTRSLLERIGMI